MPHGAVTAIAKKLGLPQTEETAQLNGLLRAYYEKNPQLPAGDAKLEQARKEAGEEGARIFHFTKIAEAAVPDHAVTRQEAEELTGFSGKAYDQEFLSKFPSELLAPLAPARCVAKPFSVRSPRREVRTIQAHTPRL